MNTIARPSKSDIDSIGRILLDRKKRNFRKPLCQLRVGENASETAKTLGINDFHN